MVIPCASTRNRRNLLKFVRSPARKCFVAPMSATQVAKMPVRHGMTAFVCCKLYGLPSYQGNKHTRGYKRLFLAFIPPTLPICFTIRVQCSGYWSRDRHVGHGIGHCGLRNRRSGLKSEACCENIAMEIQKYTCDQGSLLWPISVMGKVAI